MVKRVENWPMVLATYLKECKDKTFSWGSHDCMAFVCKAFERLTDSDIYKDYSGYDTEDGAKEVVDRHGGMIEIINKHCGDNHSHFLKAGRGDIVLVKLPLVTAGIVDDSGMRIAVVTEKGLIRLPLNKAIRIWSY